jgi:hypothetical protein
VSETETLVGLIESSRAACFPTKPSRPCGNYTLQGSRSSINFDLSKNIPPGTTKLKFIVESSSTGAILSNVNFSVIRDISGGFDKYLYSHVKNGSVVDFNSNYTKNLYIGDIAWEGFVPNPPAQDFYVIIHAISP